MPTFDLELLQLPGCDPLLPRLFKVAGQHPLHNTSLMKGNTYLFFCDTSEDGRRQDAEYFHTLQVPSGSLHDVDQAGELSVSFHLATS
jgi:hypothetical protein